MTKNGQRFNERPKGQKTIERSKNDHKKIRRSTEDQKIRRSTGDPKTHKEQQQKFQEESSPNIKAVGNKFKNLNNTVSPQNYKLQHVLSHQPKTITTAPKNLLRARVIWQHSN